MTNINAPSNGGQGTAEAEVETFREQLGPFVVAVERTRMPMAFTSARIPDDPIIFANESFFELTGYDREEVLGRSVDSFLDLRAEGGTAGVIEQAIADPPKKDPSIRVRRKDGGDCWATLFVAPVEDDRGEVAQHFVSLADISRHKKAAKNAALLIDELNHRVKNTLVTVQAIVSQAFRNSQDPREIRQLIESRIGGLSRSHELLDREQWQGVGLHDLVCEVLEPFKAARGQEERIIVDGENIRLSPKATLALGIAFNELATNAIKYGALSTAGGAVSVTWTTEERPDGRWLCLHWRETGGPRVTEPSRKGFGSRVIEHGLAHELAGQIDLDFLEKGVVCTIYIPAPKAILDE